MPTQVEYEQQLNAMLRDIAGATNAFYAYLEIYRFNKNIENKQRLDQNGEFWDIVRYSMQTTFIINLGRIFDRRRDAHSLLKFLDVTKEHLGFFSRSALANRKQRLIRETTPSHILQEYLRTTWQPTRGEIGKIQNICKKLAKEYETVEDIRDEIFAHRGRHAQPNLLLTKNDVASKIEELLYGLNEIINAIFKLFHDGHRYDIGKGSRTYIDEIVRDTRAVLHRL